VRPAPAHRGEAGDRLPEVRQRGRVAEREGNDMSERDMKGEATAAAAALVSEHGWPRSEAVVPMLAMAWLQGHLSGTRETMAMLDAAVQRLIENLQRMKL
jgi:hypothetical protein